MAESPTITVRENTTSDIDFQLLAGNTAINLTGIYDLQMEMRDKSRKVYSYSNLANPTIISFVTKSEGKVRFTPPSETIFLSSRSPYKGYWKVWETSSKWYACPEDSEFLIYVREEY